LTGLGELLNEIDHVESRRPMPPVVIREPSTWPPGFVPVMVDTLRSGSELDFDLHIQRAGQMVHFRDRGLVFSPREADMLEANGIETLWVEEEGGTGYGRYLERQLDSMMDDETVETEARAHALYASSRSLTLEILGAPSRENMQRAEGVVQHTVGQVLGDPRSLSAMVASLSTQYELHSHSVNVSVYTVALARHVGESDDEDLTQFGLGGLLHDLGKSLIDAAILNKPSRLTSEEWKVMNTHPEGGYDLLGDLADERTITGQAVVGHHERVNGTGYPHGLEGDSIPLPGRIVSIADAFDALTTKRVYKDAIRAYDALKIMGDEMSGHFDRELLRAFIGLWQEGGLVAS
jgi:HD-GYP domain-containing protein (c-di-GMP phosphodiesterase class II)